MLLNQSADVLNKNEDMEEIDASAISKWDNRSHTPFDNQDTQTEIVMAEKKDNGLTLTTRQLSVTGNKESIIVLQKVAPANLSTTEELLGMQSISPDHGGYNHTQLQVIIIPLIFYPLLYYWVSLTVYLPVTLFSRY